MIFISAQQQQTSSAVDEQFAAWKQEVYESEEWTLPTIILATRYDTLIDQIQIVKLNTGFWYMYILYIYALI